MQIQFQILRQAPNKPSYAQTYCLEADPSQTILDCLNRIKWEQDGSLAFRKNCRNTICGSCTLKINGRSALACKENVEAELKRAHLSEADMPTITIAPMGNLPVIKDLVVDMQPFWQDLQAITPYISRESPALPEREFLQSPAEREALNQVGNCILCGACYSECNGKLVNPDFVGPHALAKAQRLLEDGRDQATQKRWDDYGEGIKGVWGCTRCYLCNAVCPMEVAPMDQIGKIKQKLLAQKNAQTSRPLRHRKVLIDLVKSGGWVDERKFGLYVVGNYGRDLKGIASILPLGLRMLSSGKFPVFFEASAGTESVRALIEHLQSDTPS